MKLRPRPLKTPKANGIFTGILTLLLPMFFQSAISSETKLIGTQTFEAKNESSTDILHSRLWFSVSRGNEKIMGESRVHLGYRAVENAVPMRSAPMPLIILCHGSGGSAESLAWIAGPLAVQGALVVAADHPKSSGGDPERREILDIWNQPNDIKFLLDQLLASPWAKRIDLSRISIIGFSLGGTTALTTIGATFQFKKSIEYCKSNNDGACLAFRKYFDQLDEAFFKKAGADLIDKRIRGAVAIAPGFLESITPESLGNVNNPYLVILGHLDQQLHPSRASVIKKHVSKNSSLIEIMDAQHFSFLPICKPKAIRILSESKEEFVCQEFGSRSREMLHVDVLKRLSSFLKHNHLL